MSEPRGDSTPVFEIAGDGPAGTLEHALEDPEDVGLGRKVGQGLGWSLANNFVARLGTVLSGIVLARLLVPSDFGVFAVALVILNAGLSMNELGVSLAVIRWRDGVERIAPTVSTLALCWSGFLYLVCFVGAPGFASLLNAPVATPLIRVLALGIVIDAISCVPAALITRYFMQRTRMAIDMISFVVGTTVSIVLAFAGAGAWCIVWGYVVTSATSAGLTLLWAPARFFPGFDRHAARSLLAFGLPLAGSSALLVLMVNVDYVIVGRVNGSDDLGFYLLAFNLCSWPVTFISVAVRRVSLAGFSRVADEPARAGFAFNRAAGLIMAVTLPMCAALAAFAPAVIDLLYGDKWGPAADVLRFLCILGAARVGVELSYDYLVAVGKTMTNFVVQVIWLVVLVPVLTIAAIQFGIEGVAIGHALVALFVIAPAYLLVLRHNHVSIRQLCAQALRPCVAAGLILAVGPVVANRVPAAFPQLMLGGLVVLFIVLIALHPLWGSVRELWDSR